MVWCPKMSSVQSWGHCWLYEKLFLKNFLKDFSSYNVYSVQYTPVHIHRRSGIHGFLHVLKLSPFALVLSHPEKLQLVLDPSKHLKPPDFCQEPCSWVIVSVPKPQLSNVKDNGPGILIITSWSQHHESCQVSKVPSLSLWPNCSKNSWWFWN